MFCGSRCRVLWVEHVLFVRQTQTSSTGLISFHCVYPYIVPLVLKVVSATWQSGRYNYLKPRGRYCLCMHVFFTYFPRVIFWHDAGAAGSHRLNAKNQSPSAPLLTSVPHTSPISDPRGIRSQQRFNLWRLRGDYTSRNTLFLEPRKKTRTGVDFPGAPAVAL